MWFFLAGTVVGGAVVYAGILMGRFLAVSNEIDAGDRELSKAQAAFHTQVSK